MGLRHLRMKPVFFLSRLDASCLFLVLVRLVSVWGCLPELFFPQMLHGSLPHPLRSLLKCQLLAKAFLEHPT